MKGIPVLRSRTVRIESWNEPERWETVVRSAVETLRAGQWIGVPTESVYVAAGLAVDAAAMGRETPWNADIWLTFSDVRAAREWVPGLGHGTRLARKCWPGPVNVLATTECLDERLAASLRDRLHHAGAVELANPDHPAILAILRFLDAPLAVSPLALAKDSWAVRPQEARSILEGRAELMIDAGECAHAALPSLIRARGAGWELVRESAVSAQTLEFLHRRTVVFVCTGNTCRSPMAEALFRKAAAERLGCAEEDLPGRGIEVRSAGLSAMMGMSAAQEAQETVRELGASLENHRSQPLTRDLARDADLLLAMTDSHLRQIDDRFSHLGVHGRLLCPSGEDIADPIGSDLEVYRTCAQQIQQALEAVLPEVLS